MTRCNLHPDEAGVGVCASCLRERLLVLIDAKSEFPPDYQHRRHSLRKFDPPPTHPQPLVFPRSVSPYVSQRRFFDYDAPDAPPRRRRRRHLLFYSTPQVGPAASANAYRSDERPRRQDRFSLLKSLFGNPRSAKAEPDPGSSKRSWFSAFLRGRGRRKPPPSTEAASGLPCRASDRGMSLAIEDCTDDYASHSGYSTESSSSGWRLPATTPMRQPAVHHHHHERGVSGFAVCLNPQVRATPRQCQAAESGFSGELGRHHQRHASFGAASLGTNRSQTVGDLRGMR